MMTCCCLLCLYLSPCLFPCLLSGRMTMLQAFLRQLSQRLSFPCFHPFVKNSFPREDHAGSFVVPLHGFRSRTNNPFILFTLRLDHFFEIQRITRIRKNSALRCKRTCRGFSSVQSLKPSQGRFRSCPGSCRRNCECCCNFRLLFLQSSNHGRLLAVPFWKGRSAFTI